LAAPARYAGAMKSKSALLVLPAALAVTTFVVAAACHDNEPDYCVDIEQMSKCNEAEACAWNPDSNDCENTCHEVQDEQVCMEYARCVWYADGTPEGAGTGTGTGGGDGACGQNFT
jgi:hypothetical protein